MSEELVDQLRLELIPGVGHKGVKQLISYCGSASAVFRSSKSKLLKVPGVGQKMANTLVSSSNRREAELIISASDKIDAKILHYTNPLYPKRLKQIPDAPSIIYVKGNGDLNSNKSIAVVGARKATNYGKNLTESIVADLSTLNVTVVSGLAYGIDIQAHRVALKNKTPTYAVIAGGLDRVYPSAHKKYAEELLEIGGLVSESPPGTKPDPHLFPSRNRIIAGLTDATIVVEAAERGGALITASLADSYNRLVFAVPGNLGNSLSTGTNKLIASQKALIYTGVEDLIYHLGWGIDATKQKEVPIPELSKEEQELFDFLSLSTSPREIDQIAIHLNIPVNKVASLLLTLEFAGLVKSLPGKKFCATI